MGSKRGKPLKEGAHKSKIKKYKAGRLGSEDEEIPSGSEDEGQDRDQSVKEVEESSSEEEVETAQEKRLRLAKHYLAQVQAEEAEGDSDDEDNDDIHRGAVAERLKQDVLAQAGKLQKELADDYLPPGAEDIRVLRGHQLPITCLVIAPNDKHIFTGSKDCSIIKWCVESGKKVHTIPGGRKGTDNKHIGHTAHVLCLAITTDAKFLASGDRNNLIHIWNPDTCSLIHTFKGHRDAVSGLAFRKGSHQLFSASHDRSIKIWNLDEMAYVETLFGHQDVVTGIDSLFRDRAVTSGGRDGSVRVWKVVEESQLVFHGHKGSIDCVSLINEEHFVSGADDNSIAVWSVMKKKPLVTVHCAHGNHSSQPIKSQENWVTSVTSLQNTDLIATGSKDGCIRFWKCGRGFKSLEPLFQLPVEGFVNSLQFSHSGEMLVAGIGQEHRLGRWWRIKQAKNSLCIINMNRKSMGKNTMDKTRTSSGT